MDPQELSNEDIAIRLQDLRVTIMAVFNSETYELIKEAEVRLKGERSLTDFEQLPKKEQRLRRVYEGLKKHYASRTYFYPGENQYLEAYDDWKPGYHAEEKDSRKREREEKKEAIAKFKTSVSKFLKNFKAIPKKADKAIVLHRQTRGLINSELTVLLLHIESRTLLDDTLGITNIDNTTDDARALYWQITRYKPKAEKNKATNK
jgi:hypothetical protein